MPRWSVTPLRSGVPSALSFRPKLLLVLPLPLLALLPPVLLAAAVVAVELAVELELPHAVMASAAPSSGAMTFIACLTTMLLFDVPLGN